MSEDNLITTTKYDDELVLRQYTSDKDKTLWFGPVSITLWSLFSQGYYLEMRVLLRFQTYRKRKRIYLVSPNRRRKWLLHKLHKGITCQNCSDLSLFIKDNMHVRFLEGFIKERDPYEILQEKYPVKKKKSSQILIGNRTLLEYVQDALER